ncbi:uncharacterized protein LOC135494662 isoform X2 [Lineus longissimus]
MPLSVKLLTRHPKPEDLDSDKTVMPVCTNFDVISSFFDETKEEEFKAVISSKCIGGLSFEHQTCIENEEWEKMFKTMEGKNYKLVKNRWKPTDVTLDDELPDNLSLLVSRLDLALAGNMGNGCAKDFIDTLLECIQEVGQVSVRRMSHHSPVLSSRTNSSIALVPKSDTLTWDLGYVEPPSPKSVSSRSSIFDGSGGSGDGLLSTTPKYHKVVPDHVWYLQEYPGYFVLNVECKRKEDDSHAAIMQCIKQMFTQMHFQMSTFGLMINPTGWCLILLVKSGNEISVHKVQQSFIESVTKSHSFNLENLRSLCNWLYRIMLYRLKFPSG